MIYFDNAATTPMCPAAIQAMENCLVEYYGNPSSIHSAGRKSRNLIEQARKNIAEALNASVGELFFTSGGTESNNTALKNAIRDLRVDTILSDRIEHHSVLHSLDSIAEQDLADVQYLSVNKAGRVSPIEIEERLNQLKNHSVLVSVMHANNEIGTLNDIEKIGEICNAHGTYFHTDTVQSMAHIPIDVEKLKISFLSGSAHKFHGPKGTGFLYINKKNNIKAYVHGGAQERNMRAGTENLAGIVGMHAAFNKAVEHLEEYRQKVDGLRSYFKERLSAELDDIHFNGCQENYLPTILNVNFPPHPKNDTLILNLDLMGICSSGGSACSSGSDMGSHVLNEINGMDPGRSNVRFSFSHFNEKEEVDKTIEALKTILN